MPGNTNGSGIVAIVCIFNEARNEMSALSLGEYMRTIAAGWIIPSADGPDLMADISKAIKRKDLVESVGNTIFSPFLR